MSRLTHSSGGFMRSLQMSSARLFAFVEGRLDRPFFDRLLQQFCAPARVKYQVFAMKELPGGTGGKSALLAAFKDFRRRGLLASNAFGKTMACLFFADKDVDDFTRRALRSTHLLYSQTYDLEGHLFSCGDLHRALADSCGITLEQAQRLVPNPKTWLNTVVGNWKEWVALCLVSQLRSVNCGCTFDRTSQVNPDPLAAPDATQVAAFRSRLEVAARLAPHDFDALFGRALRQVEMSIRTDTPLRYFKGKWLGHLMQRQLESQPRIPDANVSGVGDRLGVCLVGQVAQSPTCLCCAPYVAGVRAALAKL